jgi:hypothetical protein
MITMPVLWDEDKVMNKLHYRTYLRPSFYFCLISVIALSGIIFPRAHLSALARRHVKGKPPARISLQFFDRDEKPLSAGKALDRLDGLKGRKEATALVKLSDLQVIASGVVSKDGNELVFDVPAEPAGLAVNWPTRRGYSLLILDNGGAGFSSPGTINFTYQAALDTRRRLNEALAARPDYARSEAFQMVYARAAEHLNLATSASSEPVRGKEGYLALDDLAEAFDSMLAEYGIVYRKSHLGQLSPWMGVTLDNIKNFSDSLTIADSATKPYSWIRIVFDYGQQPGSYDDVVKEAHDRGFKIIGAPIDSQAAKKYVTTESYFERMKSFVEHFPVIDAWEVANEVNGDWLITKPEDRDGKPFGSLADKINLSAKYVRDHGAKVVVTLYWQLTTDPEFTTFNWARANLSPSIRENIDVVLLSMWVEDAPMGIAFDQVMRTLQYEFPGKYIGLGELGYWGDGTPKAWWAYDERDRDVGRRRVAAQYYSAALGYERSIGGSFWWYFYKDVVKKKDVDLREAITNITKALNAGTR